VSAAVLAAVGAFATAQRPPPGPIRVAVSILPQAYFVERVGGSRVQVQVLVGPGQSPHAFEPTPRQLEDLSRAQVYFRVGIDFEEALVPRIEQMFRSVRIVDTRKDIPLRTMTAAETHADPGRDEHAHEPGEPRAGRPDPHIWLNPLYVKTQAETICDALGKLDPAQADEFRKNLAAFQADLDRVHAQIADTLAPLRGREIFVFHPAFGYFTDAYGLKQVPVEIEGKEPTARELTRLIGRARAAGVKVIFVQPQFSPKSAAAVAETIGGAVVPMDDLPRDYLKNLEDMAAKVRAAVEGNHRDTEAQRHETDKR